MKTVLSSGKKAIGAKAGNPPVVVDATPTSTMPPNSSSMVRLRQHLPCTARECVAVDSIVDLLKFKMVSTAPTRRRPGSWPSWAADRQGRKTEWVRKPASQLLEEIGSRSRWGATDHLRVSKDHPFVQHELMMPVLGIVRVPDVDSAIDLACELEHGNRHTAIMHSKDVTKLTKMGKLIQTTIYVKNGPSFAGIGIGGEGYPTFTIAGPTGEGLTSPRSFCRRRRCAMVGELNVR